MMDTTSARPLARTKPVSRPPLPLFGEQPEVARWLAEGERLAQTYGARVCAAVAAAKRAFLLQNGDVSRAIDELCEERIAAWCWAGELYAAYVAFCLQNRVPPLTQTSFGTWLSRAGFPAAKSTNGRIRRLGLTLKGEARAISPSAPIAKWVRKRCEVSQTAAAALDARFSEFTRKLFGEFEKCGEPDAKPMTIAKFGHGLGSLGFPSARIGRTRRTARIGIRLREI